MTLSRVRRTDVALLLAAAVVVASVVMAALLSPVGSLDDRARVIEAQLRCPTCQGLSIADSPATSANQMRALVGEQLAAGASDDQVRAFFVARYGRWILLAPPLMGPDLALWIAPVVIVAVGTLLVVRRARAGGAGLRRPSAWPAVGSAPRLSTFVVGMGMALALAVPVLAAIGPRLAGGQVSGGTVSQTSASIDDLQAFVRVEPRDVLALIALGDALLAANRPGEAAESYKQALEVDPANVSALLGVGTILLAADRPDAASLVFDRILAVEPNQPDALLYRAVARLRLAGSLTNDVRRDVERFLELAAPGDPRRAMATSLLEASPGRTDIPSP